jgi:hypothetical protein
MARAQGKKNKQKGIKKQRVGNGHAAAAKREARIAANEDLYGTWYKPSKLPEIIEMGKQGKTEMQIAAWLFNVPRVTMRSMARRHPELQAALDLSRAHAQAWWEEKGQGNLSRPNFNTHLYNKKVSCRFREDYSDRMTIEGDADKPLVHKIERVIVKAKKERSRAREEE